MLSFLFELFYNHLNLLNLLHYPEYLFIRNNLVVGIFFDNGTRSQNRRQTLCGRSESFEEIYTFFKTQEELFDIFRSFCFCDKLRRILSDRSLLGVEDMANTLLLKCFQ